MRKEAPARRVLCVDDDVHVLAIVTDTLTPAGFDVETAIDGAHALDKIAVADRPYDILIIDGRMPNLEGWRVVMAARTGKFAGRIIVFSAFLDADERERYRDLHVDRFIEKPPRTGELLAAVQELAPARATTR